MQAGINLNKIIGLVIRNKFKITKILLIIYIPLVISCKIQKNPYAACELLRTKISLPKVYHVIKKWIYHR